MADTVTVRDYDALARAARRYKRAISRLGERVPGKPYVYFEASPTYDQECYDRWTELNDAGKRLSTILRDD